VLVNKIHFRPKMQWSVRCCTFLDPFLWISGMLNDMFVSGLCGLASLPFHSQWPVTTFSSVRVCFSLPLSCLWLVLHVSQISVNNNPTFSLLQFILKNSGSILQRLYFLNQYKFLVSGLSPLLNGTLHHRYSIGALKIIIYDSIICFCLQTLEMHKKLNKI